MMTSLIGFLSLFSALTATSSALSCTKCSSTSSTCSGSSVTCPVGFMCGSVHSRVLGEAVRSENLIRGCTPSSECKLSGTMSITQGRIALGISCCSTDNCTPTLPTVPTKSHNPNGVICQSCVSAQSTWCYTSDTIQCTADENMCLLQGTEIPGLLSTAVRGCATKSLCDLGSHSYTAGGSTIKSTFTCTSSAISAHKVVLTPAILCLLLLKLFL
ncbi:phospholipase A2 inhibitor and Ly6/PLAUR domain-containing protein-like [Eleutherodactylus coqui]|uniref:phospholipase A2 inhibitor and Ly6/PLAUR domain-containing protein-like n=1 Tax=Eleutherodactylus coqui TaxID=57060 RepID=UPI0034628524